MHKLGLKQVGTLILMAFSITACMKNYSTPRKSLSGPALATIAGTITKEYFMVTSLTEITSIDGRRVSNVFGKTKSIQTLKPGKHKLIVDAAFTRGFASAPMYALIQLPVRVKSGRHYKLKSKLVGKKIYAWLANKHGKRVSPMRAGVYHIVPKRHPIYLHWDHLTQEQDGYRTRSDRQFNSNRRVEALALLPKKKAKSAVAAKAEKPKAKVAAQPQQRLKDKGKLAYKTPARQKRS